MRVPLAAQLARRAVLARIRTRRSESVFLRRTTDEAERQSAVLANVEAVLAVVLVQLPDPSQDYPRWV